MDGWDSREQTRAGMVVVREKGGMLVSAATCPFLRNNRRQVQAGPPRSMHNAPALVGPDGPPSSISVKLALALDDSAGVSQGYDRSLRLRRSEPVIYMQGWVIGISRSVGGPTARGYLTTHRRLLYPYCQQFRR